MPHEALKEDAAPAAGAPPRGNGRHAGEAVPAAVQPVRRLPDRLLQRCGGTERLLACLEPGFADPFVKIEVQERETLVLLDADYIRHFFSANSANYVHSPVRRRALRPMFGQGIVNSDGDGWDRMRRLMAPAFSAKRKAPDSEAIRRVAREHWREVEGPCMLNLSRTVPALTFEVMSQSFFSGDLSADREELAGHVSAMLASYGEDLLAVELAPYWLPAGDRAAMGESAAGLRERIDRVVEKRLRRGLARGPAGPDLLDLLISSAGPDPRKERAPVSLQDNIISIMVAGYETTAQCIVWTLHLLSAHPGAADQARRQVEPLIRGEVPASEWPDRAPALRCAIEESLRLYPPLPLLTRQALADDAFGAAEVAGGSVVMVSTALLHRLHRYWDAPAAFRPARFSGRPAPARYSYLPFGVGPKACIGASFAMREATIAIGEFLHQFEMGEPAPAPPVPVFRFSNRPRTDICIDVRRRS